ncbi:MULTISPECIES: hypothetical protein [unclassified Streptomyces]|uniref:hypothetical protein n=1 Tax=unclassified Streptomyces TaxID=2593676 RepID=UPI0009C0F300|nr:hypothetical protein [Streptomyces sp. M41(2017)]OQQ13495.1 hypothetical protein B0675_38740 [Streptomyces sp. M41(2017)]
MVVIVVALLLLPAQGALLYAMDRLEDRVLNAAPTHTARHGRARHLRLVKGAKAGAAAPEGERRSDRRRDAA